MGSGPVEIGWLSDVKKGRYPDFYSKKVLLALFSFPGLQVTNTGLLASSGGPRGGEGHPPGELRGQGGGRMVIYRTLLKPHQIRATCNIAEVDF